MDLAKLVCVLLQSLLNVGADGRFLTDKDTNFLRKGRIQTASKLWQPKPVIAPGLPLGWAQPALCRVFDAVRSDHRSYTCASDP